MANNNRPPAGLRKVSKTDFPILHYGWMCELLPYLGHRDLYDRFDFSQPYDRGNNLTLARQVIPEFLNPADPRQRWEGREFFGMGLTHFVGMSGVEDKRNWWPPNCRAPIRGPAFSVTPKWRVPRSIRDGTSHTIMLIGSGELAGPWAVGGGATIRGAREPYFDNLTGFGSRGQPQPGALVMLADGSVRFLSKNVDPQVFRALCTIAGGESVDIGNVMQPAELRPPHERVNPVPAAGKWEPIDHHVFSGSWHDLRRPWLWLVLLLAPRRRVRTSCCTPCRAHPCARPGGCHHGQPRRDRARSGTPSSASCTSI